MTTCEIYDRWEPETDAGQALCSAVIEALLNLGDGLSLGMENSIPTVEVWLEGGAILSLQRVLSIGHAITAAVEKVLGVEISAPVHFFELRGTSVTFFVFAQVLHSAGREFTEAQHNEFGVPFSQWSLSFQDGT